MPVGSLGVEAVVCRAVQALGSGGALGRYACIAEGPGFSRAIAGVIIELRLAALAHEVLGDVAPDLLPLLRAYEAELERAKLTDWAGILAIATETAAKGQASAGAGYPCRCCYSTCRSPAKQSWLLSPRCARPPPRYSPPCRLRTSRPSPFCGKSFGST